MVTGADGKLHRIYEIGIKNANYLSCYQDKAPAVNSRANSSVRLPISLTRSLKTSEDHSKNGSLEAIFEALSRHSNINQFDINRRNAIACGQISKNGFKSINVKGDGNCFFQCHFSIFVWA